MNPKLEEKPIGVPGASSPQQMTNHKPSFASVPSPHRDTHKDIKDGKFKDAGEELDDARLQGVKVTDFEITELLKDLGMNEADADELATGLGVKDSKKVDQDSSDNAAAESKTDDAKETSASKESGPEAPASK